MDTLFPVCAQAGTSLLAWSPLGGGLLSGKYMGPRPGKGRRSVRADAFPVLDEPSLRSPLKLLARAASLEGMSMAQTAVGWLLSKPEVAGVMLGARTLAQLGELLDSRPLGKASAGLLDRGARAYAAFCRSRASGRG